MITAMIISMVIKKGCGIRTKIAMATALLSMLVCLPGISGIQ